MPFVYRRTSAILLQRSHDQTKGAAANLMKLETLLLLIRHALTAVGVLLMNAGIVDQEGWDIFAGAVLTMVGGVWSFWRKFKRQKTTTSVTPTLGG